MVSIMCAWVKKLIEGNNKVEDVVDLLVDMDCVGLKTSFSMIEKIISLYWEVREKEGTISFLKEVLRREISLLDEGRDGNKGDPAVYLAWKMMGQCTTTKALCWDDSYPHFCRGFGPLRSHCWYHPLFTCWSVQSRLGTLVESLLSIEKDS